MAEVRLYLFGAPRLVRAEQRVKIDTWKALALLAYLAMNGHVHSREALATLFWPEQGEGPARRNLRRALWTLRQVLPSNALSSDKQTIALSSSALVVDVLQYQQLVDATPSAAMSPSDAMIAQYQTAIALYTEDFLAGFTLPECPAFDEWHFFAAEQLRRTQARILQMLIRWSSDRGEFATAVEYAHHWLRLDPLHEAAHRWLMQLYAWMGRQSAALRQYETCVRLLEEELATIPEDETSQLYSMIRMKRLVPPPGTGIAAQVAPEVPAPTPVYHNLPHFSTPLLGRELELSELDLLMFDRGERLITITGLGGMGKTRLALAIAERHLAAGRLRDGVRFVSLAAIDAVQAIVPALMSVLGLPAGSNQASGDARETQVLDYLGSKQMLLIFDNFEHLLEGSTLLVKILAAAPDVLILVTSRNRLHMQTEQVYAIGGLEYPVTSTDDSTPALALFLHTARRIQPHFQPVGEDRVHLVQICHLVAGMPLALELAAGWVHLLTPSAIAAALQTNLDLLESTLRDVPPRHRTMRAVLDGTWMLLSEDERQLFAQLSLFRGGFTLEAAQQITGANLKQLSALAGTALIEYRSMADRYEIHELLRQYGAEKLLASNTYEQSGARLVHYFLQLSKRSERQLRGVDRAKWMSVLEREHHNLQVAFDWACREEMTEEALEFAGALLPYWLGHGDWVEGARCAEAALALRGMELVTPTQQRAVAKVLYATGIFAWYQSDYARANACADESLRLFEQIADELGSAQTYQLLGLTARAQRDFAQATLYFSASLDLAHKCGDNLLIATILSDMGAVSWRQSDYIKATELYEESLAYYQVEQDGHGVAESICDLATVACWQGQLERARTLGQQSLTRFRQLGDPFSVAQALSILAIVATHQDELDEAQSLLEEALACYRMLSAQRNIATAGLRLGHVQRRRGNLTAASQLYDEATLQLRRIGDRLNLIHAVEAWLYMAVCHGKFELATRLAGTAKAWRERLGTPRPPLDVPEYDRHMAIIFTTLGETSFKIALAEGQELSLEQALDEGAN